MKYLINKTNFKDFSVFEINRREGRGYFIPYSSEEVLKSVPLNKERYSSDMTRVLSGDWEFKYYASVGDLPDEIESDNLDFDKITVPSTWQRTGYESPVYLNCPYPFDDAPPNVPEEQSVGIYRKTFEISDLDKNYFIAFLGVIPCVDLYLNGKFVGYGEGAHNTSEFDVTKYVVKGKNELLAAVHKWSTGTFLECQDMFRENGIFRDVLLFENPKTFLDDVYYRTERTSEGWELDARVKIKGETDGYSLKIELYDKNKLIAEKSAPAAPEVAIKFDSLDVAGWNAEIPTVYGAFAALYKNGELVVTARNFIGFKTVKIVGNVFTFNGKKIKFKGVNHHDTHYKNGYVLSAGDIEKDIKLMKSLNVNAVRTSHYPPDPLFPALCDLYGLYVVDEADIETHGCCCEPHNNGRLISDDPKWAPRYLDRVKRMYMRDRSRACVAMWSLGNEAEGYACQDVCYKFLHENCPEIPVHYEGVIRTERHSYDVVSEMYAKHKDVKKAGELKRGRKYASKPFFLCEYAHAMGVGPGGLEEYWDIFYKYDNLMGGCIWEWADHAVYHPNGGLKFTYGGDHGEKKHDGCFCVDGLVYPDRRLHTGAKEMKNVYRPVRARLEKDGLVFLNTNRFRNASYLTAAWELVKNGDIRLSSGEFVLDIEPEAEKKFRLDPNVPEEKCDLFLNVRYYDGKKETAFEQIAVKEEYETAPPEKKGTVSLTRDEKRIAVDFGGGSVVFSRKTGEIESYSAGGAELINQNPAYAKGPFPNVFRAPLDNDRERAGKWIAAGLDDYRPVLTGCEAEAGGGAAAVSIKYRLRSKKSSRALAAVEIDYEIYPGGAVKVAAKLTPLSHRRLAAALPRFGLTLELPKEFRNMEYYGMGEAENLSDMYAQAIVGVYSTTVEQTREPYVRPQDYGVRTAVRYLRVVDGDGEGVGFAFDKKYFNFNVREFSQKLLQEAKHQEDLHDENSTVVNIDGFTRGTGTASCGPDVLPQFENDARKGLEFGFYMYPIRRPAGGREK